MPPKKAKSQDLNQIAIRVTPEVQRAIRIKAANDGITFQEVGLRFVQQWLEGNTPDPPLDQSETGVAKWTPDQAHAHHQLDEVLRRGTAEEIEIVNDMIDLVFQQIDEREHGKEADATAAEVFRYVKKRARIIAEHRLALSRK